MTPVVLLTDAFVANGSAAWKLPKCRRLSRYRSTLCTSRHAGYMDSYQRDEKDRQPLLGYPGTEGFTHVLGGLEKDNKTGAISTDPENHDLMTRLRAEKIAKIEVPDVEVEGDKDDADLLIVGFGGTYGHLHAAMDELRAGWQQSGSRPLQIHQPLPKNTEEVMKRYKKVVVAEQNMGQFAGYLRMKVDGFVPLPVQSGKRSAFPGK